MRTRLEVQADRATLLDRIHLGREAQRRLDADPTSPIIVGSVAPMFVMEHPKVNMGRKQVFSDTRHPVRALYSADDQRIFTACAVERRLVGLGWMGEAPTIVMLPRPRKLDLRRLAKDGREAYWELCSDLECWITTEVTKASAVIGKELEAGGQPVIDEIECFQIVTEMLYGSDATDTPGSRRRPCVDRLVDLCLLPHQFAKVDPTRFISCKIETEAVQEVRRYVGDPKLGPRIRKVVRELSTENIECILTAYRERYPNDLLGQTRFERAISLNRSANARAVRAEGVFVDRVEAA